jgi:hypothetical protein
VLARRGARTRTCRIGAAPSMTSAAPPGGRPMLAGGATERDLDVLAVFLVLRVIMRTERGSPIDRISSNALRSTSPGRPCGCASAAGTMSMSVWSFRTGRGFTNNTFFGTPSSASVGSPLP